MKESLSSGDSVVLAAKSYKKVKFKGVQILESFTLKETTEFAKANIMC